MDRNPDAQAPPPTISSHKVAKLPHPPADQVGTSAHRSVSPWRINSHCPSKLFKPHLCANPLLACCAWLRRLQFADCTLQMPSQLPHNCQNRTECIAVQRRYWTLQAASSRPFRVLSAELAINLDSCPATHPRSRFDPAPPAQPEAPLHACNTRSSICTHPPAPAARRHGGTARRFGRLNEQR